MTSWPAHPTGGSPAALAQQQAALFTAGPRLGWRFRDRRELAAPFPERPPDAEAMRAACAQRAAAAEATYRKFRKFLGAPSVIVLVLLALANGCQANLSGSGPPLASDAFALILCGPGIVITYLKWRRWRHAAVAVDNAGGDYQQVLAGWQQREAVWAQAELARLENATEWGSAGLPEGTLRADVFGGSLQSWQALLTTHGTSLLATQPLLAVDLSGELACTELTELARAAGVPTATWLLPAQLGASGLLAGLSAIQFAEALAEAVHAGPEPGNARADRAVDTRVLEQLHGALGADVTSARLAAAVRAALGHADQATPLTPAEQALITAELFPAAYRHQIEPNLVRIEAFLTDLAQHAGPAGARPPAYFTCLALEPAARSARAEMLAALAIQWLTVQVTSSTEPAPAVVICGADEITAVHLERLASACERRRVPLTLMFRHLRDTGLGVLGGGATAFMRLGNHIEAQQAADYIGRQHTFVLSQLTATDGGSRTHTTTRTEGHTVTDTLGVGWHTGWVTSRSPAPGSSSESESGGSNRSQGRSVSRTWSTAWSQADGTTWSNAAATQRVYEYAVEPAVLQNLPDHALLLVTRRPGGPALQPIECDPAIITLPRASTSQLPDLAPHTQAASPGASWPAWAQQPLTGAPPQLPEVPGPSASQAR